VQGSADAGTLPGTTMRINLAAGRTINSASLVTGTNKAQVGRWTRLRSAASAISSQDNEGPIFFDGSDTSNLYFAVSGSSFQMTKADVISSNERVLIEFDVPIAEWAGAVSTAPVQAEEFVADDGTSDVFGPNGAAVPAITLGTGTTARSFSFQYPIQGDDAFELEIQVSGMTTAGWIPSNQRFPWIRSGATDFYGMCMEISTAGVCTVYFGNRGAEATASFGANGQAWTAVTRFRMRKTKKSALPFKKADSVASGLVAPRKGQTSLTVTSTVAGWATARAVGVYYQDQDGNHRLKFNIAGTVTSGTYTGGTWTVTGVTFKSVADYYQAISCFASAASITSQPIAYANTGASTIVVAHASAASTTRYCLSGDVELDSKPSWA
jgi:hypothetical protein